LKSLGIPVLGMIPEVFNDAESRRAKKKEMLLYTMAGLYCCLIGSTLVFEVLGIDYYYTLFQGLPVDGLGEVVDNVKAYVRR